jgi:class 3 adenylate cyclase
MGGRKLKLRNVPMVPGSPRIRVRGFAMMGGVHVRSKPTRATGEIGQSIVDHVLGAMDSLPALTGASGEPVDLAALGRDIRDQVRAQRRAGRQRSDERHERHERHAPGRPRYGAAGPPQPDGGAPSPESGSSRSAGDGAPGSGEGTVTILFSDMVDYAGMTERLGDQVSRELLREHHLIVRQLLENHGGREVKVQGDGFMVAFGGVARALRCAADMQRAFLAYSAEHRDRPIQVHIGIHTGEAMEEEDDFLGHTVIVASRLADVAGPGEVLVSGLSAQLVERTEEFVFVDFRQATLKGLTRPQQVATLAWGPA